MPATSSSKTASSSMETSASVPKGMSIEVMPAVVTTADNDISVIRPEVAIIGSRVRPGITAIIIRPGITGVTAFEIGRTRATI